MIILKISMPILFYLISFSAISSQESNRVTILGRVTDANTGNPISFVNVFIANTTKGTTTDENGLYKIDNIPLGKHQLVISMMGYKVETRTIIFAEPVRREMNFHLKQEILEFPDIEVEASVNKEWLENLKIFKKELLGYIPENEECEIQNPEVLDFKIDNETEIFTAEAIAPLEIENRMLGYHLHGVLKYFTLSEENCEYIVIPKFTELETEDEKEKSHWQERRRETYKGSFRHFFTALQNGKLHEERFRVYHKTVNKRNMYILMNSEKVRELLISPGKSPHELNFHFNRHLIVEYVTESGYKIGSTITSLNDTIAVSFIGKIEEFGATIYGSWSNLRIARELPVDYMPIYKEQN